MLKKVLSLALFMLLVCSVTEANVKKVAVVDIQKVINKSAQVQALKKDEENKRKELANLINKANEEIKKQSDITKKKMLAEKYDKEIRAKQEANTKAYGTKLEAIDKNINATITQQAKSMGYDMVLLKGVVLFGGDDITEAILKVVK